MINFKTVSFETLILYIKKQLLNSTDFIFIEMGHILLIVCDILINQSNYSRKYFIDCYEGSKIAEEHFARLLTEKNFSAEKAILIAGCFKKGDLLADVLFHCIKNSEENNNAFKIWKK